MDGLRGACSPGCDKTHADPERRQPRAHPECAGEGPGPRDRSEGPCSIREGSPRGGCVLWHAEPGGCESPFSVS